MSYSAFARIFVIIESVRTSVVRHPRVVRRMLPGCWAASARPKRMLPGRQAAAGADAAWVRADAARSQRADAAAASGQHPLDRTTPKQNLKTLAYAAILIFPDDLYSPEKRLTVPIRTCRGRAPETSPDHRTRQSAPLLCGRFLPISKTTFDVTYFGRMGGACETPCAARYSNLQNTL